MRKFDNLKRENNLIQAFYMLNFSSWSDQPFQYTRNWLRCLHEGFSGHRSDYKWFIWVHVNVASDFSGGFFAVKSLVCGKTAATDSLKWLIALLSSTSRRLSHWNLGSCFHNNYYGNRVGVTSSGVSHRQCSIWKGVNSSEPVPVKGDGEKKAQQLRKLRKALIYYMNILWMSSVGMYGSWIISCHHLQA